MTRPALFFALLAFGCGGPASSPKPMAAPSTETGGPVSVSVVSPKRQSLSWTVEQPGTVTAFEVTPVVAKLPGYVAKVNADIGDTVTAGQVLAVVSIPELAEEKKQKDAAVQLAKAEVTQAERAVDEAAARVAFAAAMTAEAKAGLVRLDADIERWDSELRRVSALVSSRVVEAQVADETRNQAKAARAARQEGEAKVTSAQALAREATARVARAEADVAAAKAKQSVAEAEVGRVVEMLKYTQVRAPFAGVVTARHVHTGHFLMPSSTKPDALFTVARLDLVRVFAEVPEASAGVATVGAAVVVRVPALKNRDFPGTITRTARVLNGESRTLKVEIDLPNKDGTLRPGQYVTVKIAATTTQALTVPTAAVLFADETAYCYLVENGKAVKTRVQVGRAQAGVVEVLARRRAGITSGDWVPWTGVEQVVDGKLGELADGQPVVAK